MRPEDEPERPRSDRVVMPRRLYESIFGSASGVTRPSLVPRTPTPPVPPEDTVPALREGETDVWLTEWQIEEDGYVVAVGDEIAWALYAMDQLWVGRILKVPRNVPLQLDFSADELTEVDRATRRDLRGAIVRIDQVSVRFVNDPDSRGFSVPETNGGQQHSVSSLSDRRPHRGNIIGWIVRVRS
ncbi:DUF6578 domain-containing protein [Curtobacterium sp. AB7]|uniref:DUF6578 domain-containing protein n=1 Tax=Curtobacterium sp. AB7 TaxID=3349327 RepID=UPI0038382F61